MKKTVITFGDIKIKKQRFYQHKRPISIRMRMIYIIRMILNILLAIKMLTKLDLYSYLFQK